MFELKQLRCFVAVAAELNFRRAAESLNMTQPPLSRQIQLLEREIGVEVFDRSGRTVRLTSAGRRFFVEAQDLLRRAEAAALSARRANEGDEGTVILGFIPVASLGLLPLILSKLRKQAPGIDLVLKEMLSIGQVEALRSGLLHLGIMRLPRDQSGLNFHRIWSEPYILAVHKEHRFANGAMPVIEDLDGEPFIMYSPSDDGWYGYEILSGLLVGKSVRPNYVQHIGQTHTILAMVNAGLGLALVPASSTDLGFADVSFREIELPSHVCAELHLAWSRSLVDNPVVTKATELIVQETS